MTDLSDISVLPAPSAEWLDSRQAEDYRAHREALLEWLLVSGKDPETADGYAQRTVQNTAECIDIFYRWVWDERGSYTTHITHDDADAYMRYLARKDESNYSRNNTQSSIKRLFKWRAHRKNGDLWGPDIVFTEPSGTIEPREFLTRDERRQIREAALEYGSIPSYGDLSPDERDRWRAYLAQRFSVSKGDVMPADWERANSWKFPSLVWTSLDTGLRPIEVEQQRRTGWTSTMRSSGFHAPRVVRTMATGP